MDNARVAATEVAGDEDALERSRRLAGLIGPILITAAISEAMNLRIWATGNPPVTYLVGLLWFVAGVAVVRAHHHWSRAWPVTITVIGWFLVIGGAIRMFFPEAQQGNANTPVIGTYAVNAVLLAFGCLMTYKAYGEKR